jgi:shikimate kinase
MLPNLTSPPPSQLLKGLNVYLIGMMGAGKTTIGQVLATRLGYQFFDTDAVVEQVAGQAIGQIFAAAGEASFRQWETAVLGQLAGYTRKVIATGGGIVLRSDNWQFLRYGLVIWLDAAPELIVQRLQADTTRPLLQGEDLRTRLDDLLAQRQALYRQADLTITITATATPEQICDRMVSAIAEACQKKLVTDAQIQELNSKMPYQVEEF